MIDATRSPRPLWRRAVTMLAIVGLIMVLAWAIWVKELHHAVPQIKTISGIVAASSLVVPSS